MKIESDDMANDDLFYKLGQMFKFGLGTDSDVTKAIEYFRRSAEMNNKNGLFEYGKALLIGEHIPQDTDSALKILEKAVKLKTAMQKDSSPLNIFQESIWNRTLKRNSLAYRVC